VQLNLEQNLSNKTLFGRKLFKTLNSLRCAQHAVTR
jgi:hypothetical protein